MKKFLIFRIVVLNLLFFCYCCNVANAQEDNLESKERLSKIELFQSKKGVIIKSIDYNLPPITTMYTLTSSETKIRVLKTEDDEKYFYQIKIEGKSGSSTASIEYQDLLELIKAIKTLKAEENADVSRKNDYLENKFITSDGFQVGYRIKNGRFETGKSTWYMGQGVLLYNEATLKSVDDFEQALENAKMKIDELKALTE